MLEDGRGGGSWPLFPAQVCWFLVFAIKDRRWTPRFRLTSWPLLHQRRCMGLLGPHTGPRAGGSPRSILSLMLTEIQYRISSPASNSSLIRTNSCRFASFTQVFKITFSGSSPFLQSKSSSETWMTIFSSVSFLLIVLPHGNYRL